MMGRYCTGKGILLMNVADSRKKTQHLVKMFLHICAVGNTYVLPSHFMEFNLDERTPKITSVLLSMEQMDLVL